MLAIHGLWAHGVLSLWAEDSEQPAPALSGPRAGPGVSRRHPFAAPAGLLADVIAEFGETASDVVRKAADDELTLWLPSTAIGPVASPELVIAPFRPDAGNGKPTSDPIAGHAAEHTSRIRLSPWQVPALSFSPAAALSL